MGLLDEAIKEHLELKRRRGADPSEVDRLEREALGPVRRTPHDAPDALVDAESSIAEAYPAEEEVPYALHEVPEWRDDPADEPSFDDRAEAPSGAAAAGQWEEVEPATEIARAPENDYEADMAERSYDPPRHHEIAEEWEAHERQGFAAGTAGFEPDEAAPVPPAPPEPAGEAGYPPPARDPAGPVSGSEHQRPVPPGEEYGLEQETLEHDVEAEELGHPSDAEARGGEDVLEETPDFLQDTPDHDRLWFEQRPPRDFDFDE